tara:strand:+ start:922 stop:1059 length:138 start_codon:yes stop_codon:yes gene_type:complete
MNPNNDPGSFGSGRMVEEDEKMTKERGRSLLARKMGEMDKGKMQK